ncbi:MAG: hypothetical protein ABFS16_11475 [Bacteroidota bacterium]
MRRKTILLSIVLMGLFAINLQAQQIKVPKSSDLTQSEKFQMPDKEFTNDMLKALSPGNNLDISPDKLLKLEKNNKSYVNDVLGVLSGTGTDDQKKTLIDKKKSEQNDFIDQLLGEGKAAKYYKLVKKQVEPLVKKYALAKFFI